MQYVYVLESEKDGNLYIGCTSDLKKRFAQHQKGAVRATKGRLPVRLRYSEAYESVYEAFRQERFYKTAKGKKELKAKIAGSSNGRTPPFGGGYWGSSP